MLAGLTAATLLTGDLLPLVRAVAGGLALSALFFAIAVSTRGELGMGDVKLAVLVGLVTGWFGWRTLLLALIAMFVLAGSVAISLLLTRRAARRDVLPLAPFMIAGALLSMLTRT